MDQPNLTRQHPSISSSGAVESALQACGSTLFVGARVWFCVCVCVCVRERKRARAERNADTEDRSVGLKEDVRACTYRASSATFSDP